MEASEPTLPGPSQPGLQFTDHAMLVVWGQFARQFGLTTALAGVPIAQKTVEHTPQSKVLQLLVATLAGCQHVGDMATGPHPLIKDQTVADAWEQPSWADPSGVSRTFLAATNQTVAATDEVLAEFSQPFIDREVLLAMCQHGGLCYDGDLTGREVSATSRDYPGAAFGWMGDHVGLGYQAAVVSLGSPTYGRLLLASRRHPGATVSGGCLHEMVEAAEMTTGVRPRRRSELVAQRLASGDETAAKIRERIEQTQSQLRLVRVTLEEAEAEENQRATLLAVLAAHERADKPARPYGQLTKTRIRQAAAIRRVERCRTRVAAAEAGWVKACQERTDQETAQAELRAHHARLVADDGSNPSAIRAIFRVDGGFGSGPNIAWLIEMGYEVYTKAHNAQVTAALLRAQPLSVPWVRVGNNAEVWVQSGIFLNTCPYPVDVALERFHTGDTVRHATLVHYGTDPVTANPLGWFHRYNARQTLEAGIKENKGVFQMRFLKLRSPAGLAVAEAFARFAANFVRWAAVWLAETSTRIPPPFVAGDHPINVKQMVRTGANTSAWITRQPDRGVVVTFTDRSPYAGMELAIGCVSCFQPPLPMLKTVQIPLQKTICSLVAQ
jgi:hypothetical protein